MQFSIRVVFLLALLGSTFAMRGALYRSGRSVPIRGMENQRGYVTQDFLRFGRSAPNFDEEDFLPQSRFRALRDPLDFGFIV